MRVEDGRTAEPDPGSAPASSGTFSAAMAEMAQSLRRYHSSVEETLTVVGEAALANIPRTSSAGISLEARRGLLETRSATDELPARVAEVQSDTGEGPCLESIQRRAPVRMDDSAAEQRWSAFTGRIADEPFASMLSVPLLVGGEAIGSLSLYSGEPGVFDADAEEMGFVLAQHAAVAIAGAREEEGLLQALDHRDLIGQAKGILMERHKVTADEAFRLLVRASQTLNVKLRELAAELAATGGIGRR
ncbi:MAG TPA: GAF and ANTAR domain-containing protein [Mycobacteriales bacterium]